MEIILLKDIKGIGACGDICTVSDGYAINFLIPKQHAVELSEERGKNLIAQKRMSEKKQTERSVSEQSMLNDLPAEVTVSVRVNEQDKLFQAVTAETMARVLKEKGIVIPSSWISLDSIKEVGVYEAGIKHDTFERKIKIIVKKDK